MSTFIQVSGSQEKRKKETIHATAVIGKIGNRFRKKGGGPSNFKPNIISFLF